MPWLFELWAHEHQLAPKGKWRNWLLLGGRGAGKTRAGSEWVRQLVEGSTPLARGSYRRLALVADTLDQARDVMVFGESGILAASPPDRRPKWVATKRQLQWENGAIAEIFSGSDPETLRGPQFDAAWLDEFGKWRKAQETWDNLAFALRLGKEPKLLITTTPRSVSVLKQLLDDSDTVITHAPTEANRAFLAPGFLEALEARYGGTRLGRQELAGEFVSDIEGAIFTHEMIENAKGEAPDRFDRIVVVVDPPASHHETSDACGIMVAGAVYGKADDPRDWQAYVLADLTIQGARPEAWAKQAIAAYHQYQADALIAEVNQGGNMVEAIVRQIDPLVAYQEVRAKTGKSARAEPVAALYDQKRVTHCAHFEALEEQMLLMARTGYQGLGSPDRVDALVWALGDLVIDRQAEQFNPRARLL